MTLDTARTRWIALYVLCLGDLMIVVDMSIVNVALPSIQNDLGFTETSLAWVVNAYLLTFGGFLLLGGRLGDLFGQRRLFLGGIAFFTAASIVVRRLDEPGDAGRRARGAGARRRGRLRGRPLADHGPLQRARPSARRRSASSGSAWPAAAASACCSAASSPTSSSWHWIFLVNVPIGIAVYVLTLRLLPGDARAAGRAASTSRAPSRSPRALMLAVYAIVNGNGNGWLSAQTLGLLGAAAALFAAFVVIESRVAAPLMPFAILKLRNIWASNVVGVLWAAGDVRRLLHLRALSPARARLQPAAGRARVPAGERDHGRLLARDLARSS